METCELSPNSTGFKSSPLGSILITAKSKVLSLHKTFAFLFVPSLNITVTDFVFEGSTTWLLVKI